MIAELALLTAAALAWRRGWRFAAGLATGLLFASLALALAGGGR